jgi:hypothetical protein
MNLADGLVAMLTTAAAAHTIGTLTDTFSITRVAYPRTELRDDETGLYVVQVQPRSTRVSEPNRADVPQDDIVAVMVTRRLASDELTDEEVEAFVAASELVMEQIENLLLAVANARPAASNNPKFVGLTYEARGSNPDGMIYSPEGVSQRRQFESRLLVTYREQRILR